jgi:hypothetical protein
MGVSSDNHKVHRWAARLAAGKSATTINRSLEVVRTVLKAYKPAFPAALTSGMAAGTVTPGSKRLQHKFSARLTALQ